MTEPQKDGCSNFNLKILIGGTYVASIILLYMMLNSNEWVTYDGGNSGLWKDCNYTVYSVTTTNTTNTPIPTTTSSSDKDDEQDCRYIHMQDASGSLHFTRAAIIMGFLLSCLGAFIRYGTWKGQGQKEDFNVIGVSFLCSFISLAGTLTYSLVYFDEKYGFDSSQYHNAKLGITYKIAIACVIMMGINGLLNYWSLLIFSPKSCCPLLHRCIRKPGRPVVGHGARVASSENTERTNRPGTHENTPDNSHDSNLRNIMIALRTSSTLRRDIRRPGRSLTEERHDPESRSDAAAASVSIVSSSDSTTPRDTGVTPIHLFPMPPSYDDVMRNDSTQEVSIPPPSYDEVANIPRRELIRSPPPAYKPS